MALEDHASPKARAAALTRDIVASLVGSFEKPNLYDADGAQALGNGIAKVYEVVHAAVVKSLKE